MKLQEIEVTAAELGSTLKLTERRVRQLAAEGTVIKGQKRGRYALCASVRRYIDAIEDRDQSTALEDIRREKLAALQLARAQKDRQLIALDEALSFVDEITGLFVASLNSLPAQITGVPRERQRLNEIFDTERQRIADRLAEKMAALAGGEADG